MPGLPLRQRASTALLIALACFLVACADTAVDVFDAEVASPRDEPLAARPLRLATALDPSTVDPHRAGGWHEENALIHGVLFREDPVTGALEAEIARSATESDDGSSWTVLLAEGTFHDGSAVDARAVARAIDRARRLDPESPLARSLDGVRDVTPEGPSRLVIGLAAPEPGLPRALSRLAVTVEADGVLLGCGPYRRAHADEAVVELVRHEGFAGDAPAVDRFELHRNLDAGARDAALRAKRVDACLVTGWELANTQEPTVSRRAVAASERILVRFEGEQARDTLLPRDEVASRVLLGRARTEATLFPRLAPRSVQTGEPNRTIAPLRVRSHPGSAAWVDRLAEALERATREGQGAARNVQLVRVPLSEEDLRSPGSWGAGERLLAGTVAERAVRVLRGTQDRTERLRAWRGIQLQLEAAGWAVLLQPDWIAVTAGGVNAPDVGRETDPVGFAIALSRTSWPND